MRLFLVWVALAVFPSLAVADMGLAVSINQKSAAIAVPIEVTDYIRLEPSYQISKTKDSQTREKIDRESKAKINGKRLGVAAHIFLVPASEPLRFYVGAGYYKVEEVNERNNEVVGTSFDRTEFESFKQSLTGKDITGVIGLEYSLGEYLSIAAEVGVAGRSLEGEEKLKREVDFKYSGSTTTNVTIDRKVDATTTESNIYIRFMF